MNETYRDLVAWQRAMALVTHIYRATDAFPRREIYGLTNQLRRAAVSVPSNIAEGKGRRSKKEYVQFLFKARGSLFEVETQLEIACNLEYIAPEPYAALKEQVGAVARVLSGLIAAIQKQIERQPVIPTPDSREPTAPNHHGLQKTSHTGRANARTD